MAKKLISFSKCFVPAAIFSTVIIIFGIVGICVKGINFGIDFKPGLIEEIKIAPASVSLKYTGNSKVSVDISSTAVDFVVTGSNAEKQTKSYMFANYPTVKDFAVAVDVPGVKVELLTDGSESSYNLYVNSAESTILDSDNFYLYAQNSEFNVSDVRSVLEGAGISGVSVKPLGTDENRSFQIRVPVGEDADSSQVIQEKLSNSLKEAFGAEKVVVIKTDFIGSSLSKSLALRSITFMLLTFALIWLYAAIRFHWDFALGAIVALIHDTLIMFTFISWTQMEFTTTVLAAVLTIVGYSINDTVVILDRVRSNLKTQKVNKFSELINKSLSETLSRSIITTVTTLFAVISLYIFTSGTIKDFALALIVGLLAGCYSSLFIAGGFITLCRKNWKPEYGIHHSQKAAKGVLTLDAGVQV
ncbi:MAG: protein translocase subunit SecF [Treponema sp.]|nr:protein translocase subunit SecF [Treponema sp.]